MPLLEKSEHRKGLGTVCILFVGYVSVGGKVIKSCVLAQGRVEGAMKLKQTTCSPQKNSNSSPDKLQKSNQVCLSLWEKWVY